MTRQELLDLKDKIDKAKVSKIQLETKRDSLLEEMKEKWGCATIEEAKNKVEAMDKELTETYDILQEKLRDVEKGVDNMEQKEDDYEL